MKQHFNFVDTISSLEDLVFDLVKKLVKLKLKNLQQFCEKKNHKLLSPLYVMYNH